MREYDFDEMLRGIFENEILKEEKGINVGGEIVALRKEAARKYHAIIRALPLRDELTVFFSAEANMLVIQIEDVIFDSLSEDLHAVFTNADSFIICEQNGEVCIELGINNACAVAERVDDGPTV